MDAENFHRLKAMAGHSYWYLGTAYSKYPGGRDAAYDVACHAAGRLLAQDIPIFCPITMCHGPAEAVGYNSDTGVGLNPHTAPEGVPDPWAARLAPFVRNAMGMFVLEMQGWDESVGLAAEIEEFRAAGKPILHLSWPTLEVE